VLSRIVTSRATAHHVPQDLADEVGWDIEQLFDCQLQEEPPAAKARVVGGCDVQREMHGAAVALDDDVDDGYVRDDYDDESCSDDDVDDDDAIGNATARGLLKMIGIVKCAASWRACDVQLMLACM